MLENWTLRRRLTALLLLLLIAFGSTAVVAVFAVRARNDAGAERRNQLDPARRALDEYAAAATDQETSVRGYIITRDEAVLEPYGDGRRVTDRDAVRLRDLLTAPAALRTLDTMEARLDRWRRDAAVPAIAAVAGGDAEVAAELERSGVAKARFDAFRAATADLRAALEDEARVSSERLDRLRTLVAVLAIAGFVAATVVVVLIGLVMRRWVNAPLEDLAADADRVASGRLDTPITIGGPPEVRRVAGDVEAMRTKLLGDLAGALRTNLLDVQEAERRRIAADLHDDPIQVLTVALMRLDLLGDSLEEPEAQLKLADARDAVRDAIERLRTMLFELHPPSLDREGFVAALEEYAKDLFAGADVTIDLDTDVAIEPSPAVRSVLFRVAREAIANTHKHADATRLTIRARDVHGGVEVAITDDGRGFTPAEANDRLHRGVGFAAELARTAGGWWSIESAPGDGTTVEFWLPDAVVIDVTRDATELGKGERPAAASPAPSTRS